MPPRRSQERISKTSASSVQPARLSFLWPSLVFIFFLVLANAGLFSITNAHVIFLAFSVLLMWLFAAGTRLSFWAHGLCFLVFAGLVFFGSCWESADGKTELRVLVTPPAYTKVSPFLLQARARPQDLPVGSQIALSYSGQKPLKVTFAGQEKILIPSEEGVAEAAFEVSSKEAGTTAHLLAAESRRRLGSWHFFLKGDAPPKVALTAPPEILPRKTIRLSYKIEDDFGVENIIARIAPSYGNAGPAQQWINVPVSALSYENGTSTGYVDISYSPWAGNNVFLSLSAIDGAGQETQTSPILFKAPIRTFRTPLARSLIEEREKILSDSSQTTRAAAANVMAGIARRFIPAREDMLDVLALRSGAIRLILSHNDRAIEAAADILWRVALRLEEGSPGLARLALAQEAAAFEQAFDHGLDAGQARENMLSLSRVAEAYFKACETERECGLFPLLTEGPGFWPREAFRSAMDDMALAFKAGERAKARAIFASLREIIEKMPTVRPDLTPEQDELAGQIVFLRDLAGAQKRLFDTTAQKENKSRETWRRLIAEQKELSSVVKDKGGLIPLFSAVAEDSGAAMEDAAALLQKGAVEKARARQAEALALLENALLALSDKMRQSYAGKLAGE